MKGGKKPYVAGEKKPTDRPTDRHCLEGCFYFPSSLSLFLSLALHMPLSPPSRWSHSVAIRIIYLSRLQRKLRWVEGSSFPLTLLHTSLFSLYQFASSISVYATISATGEHIFVSIRIYNVCIYFFASSAAFNCLPIKSAFSSTFVLFWFQIEKRFILI